MNSNEPTNKSVNNKDLIFVSVFLWIAALLGATIPLYAIPFVLLGLSRSFITKNTLCRVASIFVAVFVLVALISYIQFVVKQI